MYSLPAQTTPSFKKNNKKQETKNLNTHIQYIFNKSNMAMCCVSVIKQPKVEQKTYFLFGVLCGLAVYNNNIVSLPFPLVLFKKLLRVKPSLEDMREFEPVLAE